MKVPGYPSNREADESTSEATAKAGRCASKEKPSRETCLHRDINHSPGGGHATWANAFFRCTKGGVDLRPVVFVYCTEWYRRKVVGLVSVPQGGTLFFVSAISGRTSAAGYT